jgi:hypothetical protein
MCAEAVTTEEDSRSSPGPANIAPPIRRLSGPRLSEAARPPIPATIGHEDEHQRAAARRACPPRPKRPCPWAAAGPRSSGRPGGVRPAAGLDRVRGGRPLARPVVEPLVRGAGRATAARDAARASRLPHAHAGRPPADLLQGLHPPNFQLGFAPTTLALAVRAGTFPPPAAETAVWTVRGGAGGAIILAPGTDRGDPTYRARFVITSDVAPPRLGDCGPRSRRRQPRLPSLRARHARRLPGTRWPRSANRRSDPLPHRPPDGARRRAPRRARSAPRRPLRGCQRTRSTSSGVREPSSSRTQEAPIAALLARPRTTRSEAFASRMTAGAFFARPLAPHRAGARPRRQLDAGPLFAGVDTALGGLCRPCGPANVDAGPLFAGVDTALGGLCRPAGRQTSAPAPYSPASTRLLAAYAGPAGRQTSTPAPYSPASTRLLAAYAGPAGRQTSTPAEENGGRAAVAFGVPAVPTSRRPASRTRPGRSPRRRRSPRRSRPAPASRP